VSHSALFNKERVRDSHVYSESTLSPAKCAILHTAERRAGDLVPLSLPLARSRAACSNLKRRLLALPACPKFASLQTPPATKTSITGKPKIHNKLQPCAINLKAAFDTHPLLKLFHIISRKIYYKFQSFKFRVLYKNCNLGNVFFYYLCVCNQLNQNN